MSTNFSKIYEIFFCLSFLVGTAIQVTRRRITSDYSLRSQCLTFTHSLSHKHTVLSLHWCVSKVLFRKNINRLSKTCSSLHWKIAGSMWTLWKHSSSLKDCFQTEKKTRKISKKDKTKNREKWKKKRNKSGHENSNGRSLFFVGTTSILGGGSKPAMCECARASSRKSKQSYSTCTTSSGTKASRQDALINELLADRSSNNLG